MSDVSVRKKAAFQFKAEFFPMTVMHLHSTDLTDVLNHLDKTFAQAPQYFQGAPVVINTLKLDDVSAFDFAALTQALKSYNMSPSGVVLKTDNNPAELNLNHLPVLQAQKGATIQKSQKVTPKKAEAFGLTKVIKQPVRAGSQVYARQSDLVILAGINPGAEVYADGHIHVYGRVRGRVLAGASGCTQAHIFCRDLEAELVAIAGHYVVKENMVVPENKGGMLDIYLDAEKNIQIEGI